MLSFPSVAAFSGFKSLALGNYTHVPLDFSLPIPISKETAIELILAICLWPLFPYLLESSAGGFYLLI